MIIIIYLYTFDNINEYFHHCSIINYCETNGKKTLKIFFEQFVDDSMFFFFFY